MAVVVLPKELFLAQLGVGVEVAPLGVGLERGLLVNHGVPRQLGDPVDPERAAEDHLGRSTSRATSASSRFFEATTLFWNMSAGAPPSAAARW